MNIRDWAIMTLEDEAKAIEGLKNQLTDDFENSIKAIHQCKGRLIVTGVGKSGLIGAKIASTFASTGTPSFFIHAVEAVHGDLGMITSEDIVLFISKSGKTDDLLRLIPHLKRLNIPIIGMTGNPTSLIAKHCTYHLSILVEREACPLNLAPTSSTTATLAMGDAMAIALMKVRSFREADYARFHPGGNLGFRLLNKVKDIMHKDNLPIVSPNMKIIDVMFEISRVKLGLAVVVEDEKILGLITDGDIRRTIQKNREASFNIEAHQIMTKDPISINQETVIIDAEEIVKEKSLHSILVIDDKQHLVGVLDSINYII